MLLNPSPIERRMLAQSGLPGYIFAERPIKIDNSIQRIVATVNDKARKVDRKKQLASIGEIIKCEQPYISCIASEPNDLKAKVAAATLMLEIRRAHSDLKIEWHTIYGGFNDPMIRSRIGLKEGVLFLSNVDSTSTDVKRETLRDLLELNHRIPRIVVTRGCPILFFRDIGYHLNHPISIGRGEVRSAV